MNTAQDQDIVDLYNIISGNPDYLEISDEMPFAETPLHRAASDGRTNLGLEILRLKPSLGKKLNLDGLSPLDLALRNGHTTSVKRFVKCYPDLIRVQGRGGITPLHYAVETEDIDLLIEFLLMCPSSISDLTIRDETAVHIAIRNKKLRSFKVLFGWLRRNDNRTVLRWKDEDGNTVLHLAALTNQPQVMELLLKMVDVNTKNLDGKTALDLLDPQSGNNARKILMRGGAIAGSSLVKDVTTFEDYLSSEPYVIFEMAIKFGAYLNMGLKGDMRNAFLVLIALVATATYQAALTPPVGDHGSTTLAIFPNITSINATHPIIVIDNKTQVAGEISKFTIVNTICFSFAMGTCFILTHHPALYIFLYGPLCLFLVGYAYLTHGVLNAGCIVFAMLVAFLFPIFSVIPWWIIVIRKELATRRSDFAEAKYLVYSSKYGSRRSPDGPVLVLVQILKNFKHAHLRCLGI